MNRKQTTFWLVILLLHIELMICVLSSSITIIKSFCILISSFIIGCIYAKLGGNND